MKWGLDNRDFKADPKNHCINPALVSIKGISRTCASELYRLSQSRKFKSFVSVVSAIKARTKVNNGQLETLIKLDYFSDFGNPNQLLEQIKIFNKYNDRIDLFKKDIEGIIPHDLMVTMCEKETDKKYSIIKNRAVIDYLISKTVDIKPRLQTASNMKLIALATSSLQCRSSKILTSTSWILMVSSPIKL